MFVLVSKANPMGRTLNKKSVFWISISLLFIAAGISGIVWLLFQGLEYVIPHRLASSLFPSSQAEGLSSEHDQATPIPELQSLAKQNRKNIKPLPETKLRQAFITHFSSRALTAKESQKLAHKNSGEYEYAIKQKLYDFQFIPLSELDKENQEKRSRTPYGFWHLKLFYQAAQEEGERYNQNVPGIYESKLEEWKTLAPKSVTPYLLQADFHIHKAWKGRGSGFSSSVTVAGYKTMEKELKLALKELDQAEKIDNTHPFIPVFKLICFKGLGENKTKSWQIFKTAYQQFPGFTPLYSEMGEQLKHKWFGAEGEYLQFLDWIYLQEQEKSPEEAAHLYANLAIGMADCYYDDPEDSVQDYPLNWPLILKGSVIKDKTYPMDRKYLNTLAWLACGFKDKAAAKALFQVIGEDYSKRVWDSESQFKKYKAWANAESSPE